MNVFYKLLLTLNATFWVVVVYGVKKEWTVPCLHWVIFAGILFLIPVLLSFVSLLLARNLENDNLDCCIDVENINSSQVSTYLGYFFLGLAVDKWQHLVAVFVLIYVFAFVTQSQYFNPIFLLFGYNYYRATTSQGTKICIITQRKMRRASEACFSCLKRLNDTTFIELRRNQ